MPLYFTVAVALSLRGCGAFAPAPAAAPRGQRVVAEAVDASAVAGVGVLLASGAAYVASTYADDGRQDVDDKKEVEEYFNGIGFGRWNKIYSDTDDINKVQMDIRDGHQQTIDTILGWAKEENLGTVCDLGCGVGSLAIPLAQMGAQVFASDISAAMVVEASQRSVAAGVEASFETSDMESVKGKFGTVSCVDVMIHYPTDKMSGMVKHLAGLSEDRLYVSFAPKTLQYSVLKKFGSLFPGPSKATRAYLHAEADVVRALDEAGFEVKRKHLTAKSFYFSLLLEAVPKTA
ncbi:magnesium-protoporphyrin IX methyltransferase C-terminus-domain-containing protein [Pelagophyceae sp. CCMP2097]|nr:magnesium-protoporphyrin IX methyltransferase C-terminus-domain-containing protein [Pelagophyceae sp. CCMP2097]